jgi:hypothetical protein
MDFLLVVAVAPAVMGTSLFAVARAAYGKLAERGSPRWRMRGKRCCSRGRSAALLCFVARKRKPGILLPVAPVALCPWSSLKSREGRGLGREDEKLNVASYLDCHMSKIPTSFRFWSSADRTFHK